MTEIHGDVALLRPVTLDDGPELRRSFATPEVKARWVEDCDVPGWPQSASGETRYAIMLDGAVVGLIQSWEERDPDYRHAGIDIAVDPAADNAVAIRCYTKVGFRPVGVLRAYERDPNASTWHDGLLMDLLASDLV